MKMEVLKADKKVVLMTGIQPTGNIHIGNYLGSVENFLTLKQKFTKEGAQLKSLFMIADLHAPITIGANASITRRKNILNTVACLLACGVSEDEIFLQSSVPYHTQLYAILAHFANIGRLGRMTQYKDKTLKLGVGKKGVMKNLEGLPRNLDMNDTNQNYHRIEEKELKKTYLDGKKRIIPTNQASNGNLNLHLLGYPVLQAADILLYGSTHVPIGDDQKQHLELTRDVAADFPMLIKPEAIICGKRIMSLQDGYKKMSKSDKSEYSCIYLNDTNDVIAKKITKAKTDSKIGIKFEEERSEVANLLNIFSSFSGMSIQELVKKYSNCTNKAFKDDLANCIIDKLSTIRYNANINLTNEEKLISILREGKGMAVKLATPIIQQMHEYLGFLNV